MWWLGRCMLSTSELAHRHRCVQVTRVNASDTHRSTPRWKHTPRQTRRNNSAQRTGFTVSALSEGLKPTDAQADYSAFSGHMTRDLHASPWQWSRSSSLVLFRLIAGLCTNKVVTIIGKRFEVRHSRGNLRALQPSPAEGLASGGRSVFWGSWCGVTDIWAKMSFSMRTKSCTQIFSLA